jgi:hypothetical protein
MSNFEALERIFLPTPIGERENRSLTTFATRLPTLDALAMPFRFAATFYILS